MYRAFRSLRNECVAVAKLLQSDNYLELGEERFIGEVMKLSGGSVNPKRIRKLYYDLKKEAGIT